MCLLLNLHIRSLRRWKGVLGAYIEDSGGQFFSFVGSLSILLISILLYISCSFVATRMYQILRVVFQSWKNELVLEEPFSRSIGHSYDL